MVVHSGVATHASGIDRNTTMRSPNEKENKLERGSRMLLVHCVPRAQYLMKEAETKSVVAVAKDVPRAGGTVNSTRAICPRSVARTKPLMALAC